MNGDRRGFDKGFSSQSREISSETQIGLIRDAKLSRRQKDFIKLPSFRKPQQECRIEDANAMAGEYNSSIREELQEKLNGIPEELRKPFKNKIDTLVKVLREAYNDTFDAFKLKRELGETSMRNSLDRLRNVNEDLQILSPLIKKCGEMHERIGKKFNDIPEELKDPLKIKIDTLVEAFQKEYNSNFSDFGSLDREQGKKNIKEHLKKLKEMEADLNSLQSLQEARAMYKEALNFGCQDKRAKSLASRITDREFDLATKEYKKAVLQEKGDQERARKGVEETATDLKRWSEELKKTGEGQIVSQIGKALLKAFSRQNSPMLDYIDVFNRLETFRDGTQKLKEPRGYLKKSLEYLESFEYLQKPLEYLQRHDAGKRAHKTNAMREECMVFLEEHWKALQSRQRERLE